MWRKKRRVMDEREVKMEREAEGHPKVDQLFFFF